MSRTIRRTEPNPRLSISTSVTWIGLVLASMAPIASAQLTADRIALKADLVEEECPHLADEIKTVLINQRVIDSHAHTFNLGHLPIEELLYRSRFPVPLARLLADILGDLADLSDIGTTEGRGESAGSVADIAANLTAEQKASLIENQRRIYQAIRRSDRDAGRTVGVGSQEPRAETPRSEEETVQRILLDVARTVAQDGHSEAPAVTTQESLRGMGRFLGVPLKREDYIARTLWGDHQLVDTFVHHLMDLKNVYGGATAFTAKDQIERMATLDAKTQGVTRFTVAFDPFREEALDLVKTGIEKGAVGIKFYPPSGYRPLDNKFPGKPGFFQRRPPFVYLPISARRAQRRQWEARYRTGHITTEQQLDNVVMSMFELAHEQQIPVFSHHTPKGFEASERYGKHMGAPCLWRKVIESLDPKGAEKTFRLVIAHSGGGGAWLGEKKHPWEGSFAQQAYNLCVYYPNVYCDFGYFHGILKEPGRLALAKRLRELIQERKSHPERATENWDADACKSRENAPPRFHIEDKILFGTDWYMVTKENRQEELVCSFALALSNKSHFPSSQERSDLTAGFFGENALRAFSRLRGEVPSLAGNPPTDPAARK